VPASDVLKFFGLNPAVEGDSIVREQAFAKNAAAFFNNEEAIPQRGPAPQAYDKAAAIFFGEEEKVKGQK